MRIRERRCRTTSWELCIGVAAALLVAGCGDGGSSDSDMVDASPVEDVAEETELPAGTVAIEELAAIPNPANALSVFIEFRTDMPAASSLAVNCSDEYTVDLEINEPTEEHSYFVMGLYDGLDCDAEVTATTASDAVTETVSFSGGPLPEYLPEIELVTLDEENVQPGWTLTNLNNSFDNPALTVAMLDEQARIRWYHQLAGSSPGSDNDVRSIPNGVLIGGTRGNVYPTMLSWDGRILWTEALSMHHDIRLLEDGKTIRRLIDSEEGCPSGLGAGAIIEYDTESNEETWSWHLCEHFEPADPFPDWSHTNTISPVPGENAILLSLRNQNSIFKVNRETEEIEWKLGGDISDFTFTDDEVFYQQHDPQQLENGNIIIFDNGLTNVRETSRLIEVAYDEELMEAEVVWSYEPDPAIFAPIWGDADRLENGNTLGTFGRRSDTLNSYLIEVNSAGEEVWRVEYPVKWGSYRAERIAEPVRGFAVER